LDSSREQEPIPSYQALDYYSRALGVPRMDGRPAPNPPQHPLTSEVSSQLYAAVFNEGCTSKQLRERFDPLLRPKSDIKQQYEAAGKAMIFAKRLLEQLESLEGFNERVVQDAATAVDKLQKEAARVIETLRGTLKSEKIDNKTQPVNPQAMA
jgi:hypothetical protein